MKRRMKRYAEGGMMDDELEDVGTPKIEAPEDKVSEDDLSFKDIFAMKRNSGAKNFTWRGKKYTTEMAGSKKPKERVTQEITVSASRMPKRTANLAPRGSNAPSSSYEEKMRSIPGSGLGFKRIAARLGTQGQRERYRDLGMKKGGSVSSASKRADGIAQRGKTKGRMV